MRINRQKEVEYKDDQAALMLDNSAIPKMTPRYTNPSFFREK